MHSTFFWLERELPCECLALAVTPFPACPSCDGTGTNWREVECSLDYEVDSDGIVRFDLPTDANGQHYLLSGREERYAEMRCWKDYEWRVKDCEK